MAPSKRLRACDACHSIKIKCALGSEQRDPPCPRCVRLGKDCIISPPKRQKDRVAELEAQVEALSRQLASQKIRAEDDVPVGLPEKTPDSKKRRLDQSTSSETDATERLSDISHIVAPSTQKAIFIKYVNEITPRFSLVPLTLAAQDFDLLRTENPLLLNAIIYAASHGIITPDDQDQLGKIMTSLLNPATNPKVEKSIELVQTILIAAMWYKSPKHQTNNTPTTLVRLAADMAAGIGLAGLENPSPFLSSTPSQINSVDAAGTWLVCYLLSTCISVLFGTPNSVTWGAREDIILVILEYSNEQGSDRLLAQYVRAERLCEQLVTQSRSLEEENANVTASHHRRQNLVTDWKAQIPPNLACPALKFWEHAIMLYLHESVLHTSTNKQSFAAPFVAERLSVTDIPTPIVTPEHIDSIFTLRDNIHGLLDLFCSFDTTTIMALPPIIFASRVLYSKWILIKLYLATTALGNTFGNFLDPESLKIDAYLQTLIQVGGQIRQIDSKCATARLLCVAVRLNEWLCTYRATQLGQSTTSTSIPSMAFSSDFDIDWSDLAVVGDDFDTELNGFYVDPPLPEFNHSIPPS